MQRKQQWITWPVARPNIQFFKQKDINFQISEFLILAGLKIAMWLSSLMSQLRNVNPKNICIGDGAMFPANKTQKCKSRNISTWFIWKNKDWILIWLKSTAEKHAEIPCVTASVDDLHIEHSVRLVVTYLKRIS